MKAVADTSIENYHTTNSMDNKNELTDESLMPFGKFQGKKMEDVPASYLLWLYRTYKSDGLKGFNQQSTDNNMLVKIYIEENMQVLKKQSNE